MPNVTQELPKIEFSGNFIKTAGGAWHHINYITTFFVKDNGIIFHKQDQTSWGLVSCNSPEEAQMCLDGLMFTIWFGCGQ